MKSLKKTRTILSAAVLAAGVTIPTAIGTLPMDVYAAGDVQINSTNFPDYEFRDYVSVMLDSNWDGKLSASEIKNVKEISVSYVEYISDLKGIEFFTELQKLDCSENIISNLDVSKNTKLKELNCSSNILISKLDLSKNINLEKLYCSNTSISGLDISNNKKLTTIGCLGYDFKNLTIMKGQTVNLDGIDIYIDYIISDVKSSNTKVATVKDTGIEYQIKGISAGKSTISYKGDDWYDNSFTVTVKSNDNNVAVTGVKLNKTTASVTAGNTLQLTATVSPTNATNKAVTWSSSNTSVATVDSNGKVTAKKAGTAKITVKTKDGSKTATCTVTVNAKAATKKNGWYKENGGYKYYKDGKAYTGWHKMGKAEGEKTEHWSYFGKNGVIYTGWHKMGKAEGEKTEHWSYFGSNGWLRTGWQSMGKGTSNSFGENSSKHMSYFGSNGWLRTGWQSMGKGTSNSFGENTSKHMSYFGGNGWLRTGWQKIGKGTSNPDGNNAAHYSYFGTNGWLRTGLQSLGKGTSNPDGNNAKHQSYFGSNGWLRTNTTVKINNTTYTADSRGWLSVYKKPSTSSNTSSTTAISGTYILNTNPNSMKFHKTNCSAAAKISAANKKVFNGTRAQAIAQGYDPCHLCNP